MNIILRPNKYTITIIFVFLVFLFFNGCRGKKQSRKHDRISDNYALYLGISEKGSYSEYSQKVGYTLNGDENEKLLKEIVSWLGTPYKYGGATRSGADCSGFAQEVYKAVYGINLYRSTADMVKNGRRINNKSRLQEGDLVFFRISGRNISHVGIYISNGYFAHASSTRGVVVDHIEQKYYADRFAFGGRVL